MEFRTEDGVDVVEGGLYWNYYDGGPVRIRKLDHFDGWHECEQYDRDAPERMTKTTILDGSRMCSLEGAIRWGHASEGQVRAARLAHECPECWSVPCKEGCTGTD